MTTCGGAIDGYDSMPSVVIAITPPSVIRIAMTQAKIGRSMKKFDIIWFPCAALYEFSIKRLNHGEHGEHGGKQRKEKCGSAQSSNARITWAYFSADVFLAFSVFSFFSPCSLCKCFACFRL